MALHEHNFNATREEFNLITKCATRAEAFPEWTQARITTLMDLEVAHNDTPLNFEVLLAFGDFDFLHDMVGIALNMNRDTGKLENHFSPRCARVYHP